MDTMNIGVESLGESIWGEDANFEDLKMFLNCITDEEFDEF